VVLPADFPVTTLQTLDAVRARTLRQLKVRHLATILDMVFTADRRWGEPVGLMQAEGLTASLDQGDAGPNPQPVEIRIEVESGCTPVKKGPADTTCPNP